MRKIFMNITYRQIQITMPICNRIFNSCSIVHSCALTLLKSTQVKYTSFQQTLQYDKQKHTLECSLHGLSACAWGRVNTYKTKMRTTQLHFTRYYYNLPDSKARWISSCISWTSYTNIVALSSVYCRLSRKSHKECVIVIAFTDGLSADGWLSTEQLIALECRQHLACWDSRWQYAIEFTHLSSGINAGIGNKIAY